MVLHVYNKLPETRSTCTDEVNHLHKSIKDKKPFCHIEALIYRNPIHCVKLGENSSILAPLQSPFLSSSSGDAAALSVSAFIWNIFSVFPISFAACRSGRTSGSRLLSVTILFIDRTAGRCSVSSPSFAKERMWEYRSNLVIDLSAPVQSSGEKVIVHPLICGSWWSAMAMIVLVVGSFILEMLTSFWWSLLVIDLPQPWMRDGFY